jgi:FtsP/CotA-like multicopper oxidase with cupredoxin domain
MDATFSRREALRRGLTLAAMGAFPSTLVACRSDSGSAPSTTDTDNATGSTSARDEPGELRQPAVLKSDGDALAITLTAMPGVVDIGAAKPVTTFTYDNMLPGSTWELRPGQTLRVDLVNDLPPLDEPPSTSGHDRPHAWTTTNLHTHGMHVSPEGNGDDIFVSIEPGVSHPYEIEVPADHQGGLFWYHPHRHGAVAQQVRCGMAGMIIVRGEIDEVPEVKAAKEQILVIQGLELNDDFEVPAPIPDPSKTEAFYPRTQILYPINGVVDPAITMYPGEVQRWRILNAAEGKFLNLVLEGHELNVLAWDGLNLAAPEPAANVKLAAGNRVEVLVKAGAPGSYALMLTPSSSQRPGTAGVPTTQANTTSSISAELVTRPIATIVVAGDGPEMALPTSLPVWDPPILPIARRRVVSYTVEREGLEFQDFGVDGTQFDPASTPYQVKLGTAEEWTVVNDPDAKLNEHAHVFHIHVNPFKVTKINGTAIDPPLWRDTFILTGNDGDSITFESNFVDFTGRFVDHCHVLTHEDLGMMEIIEVVE